MERNIDVETVLPKKNTDAEMVFLKIKPKKMLNPVMMIVMVTHDLNL